MIDDFYQLAIAAVRHHLDQAGAASEEDDGDVLFNGHRIGISVGFDEFVDQGQQVIAPLDIQIHLDGDDGNRFRVGTLGIGESRMEAMHAAVSEWHMLAASPVLAALGAAVEKRRSNRAQRVAGWDLFAGRAGIRGPIPPGLQTGGAFPGALAGVLRETASGWPEPSKPELHSIFIMGTCGPDALEIQAAVDGIVRPEVVDALEKLPWPRGAETYLYKQLFVLRRAPEAATG